MKKTIGVGLLAFVLAILIACGSTSSNAGSINQANDSTKSTAGSNVEKNSSSKSADENEKDGTKEGIDESVDEAEGSNKSDAGSTKDSQDSGSPGSGNDKQKMDKSSENKEIEARKNSVIEAVLNFDLNFKGIKEDIKVDYESETVTWAGQKVTLEIVPASDHQDDFKAGTVKTVNDNEGKIVRLYQYKIDQHNKLSLIETISVNDESYDSVIYATYIGDSDIHISGGDAAIEYLKQQIEAGKNEDILFGDTGRSLETDRRGSYYTIRLSSKTMQENGGTGTVNIYNVYQDGSYMPRS